MTLTTLSYLGSALSYLLLAGLIVTRWRRHAYKALMLTATLVTAAWAFNLAWITWKYHNEAAITGGLLEVARNASWFALLLSMLAAKNADNFKVTTLLSDNHTLRFWIAITGGFLLIALAVFSLPSSLPGVPLWRSLTTLLMSIVGLSLVEQVYRNTPPQRRRQIKFLCLGLGGVFALDLFLYADLAVTKNPESPIWIARGLAMMLIVPLLGITFSRYRPQKRNTRISRHLLFHTTALMGATFYLFAIGVVVYFLRKVDGDIGTLLQMSLLFGAGLLLALVLFSDNVRARLRVFLSKHFFRYQYDYRHEWLRLTEMLSSEDERVEFHERCISAICELVDSSGGLLWIRHNDGYYRAEGSLNLGDKEYPVECQTGPLVSFLDRTQWIVDIKEYHQKPERYPDLVLPEWLLQDLQHWAVVPLLKNNLLEGFIVLTQPRAPHIIDWEGRDLLKTAGRQLAIYIALTRTQEALLEARQFEAFHRLAAFLVHDLKNISSQLSLICSNAERHRNNPAFITDVFDTVAKARDRLERTQTHLRTMKQPADIATQQRVVLTKLLQEVVTESQDEQPTPQLDLRQQIELNVDREGLKNTLQHLVRNAQQATDDRGWIRLTLDADSDWATISVEDNGSGMDKDFLRQRIFRPFQTTKGNAGMGIGLYEARDRIVRMGGHIDVKSELGVGTLFTLRLPR